MAHVVYIGDEVTASGYRLAGVETVVPSATEAREAVRTHLRADADLLLLSGALARELPREELERALLQEHPLVTVVPDVQGREAPPDLEAQVRLALGIES